MTVPMESVQTKYLLVSYVPENHDGDPLMAEIVLSDSHEQVIENVCSMWAHCLPPPEQRVASLARQKQRPNGTQQWVRLQPERFAHVVRDNEANVDELELRLQIERLPTSPSLTVLNQNISESSSAQGYLPSNSGSSGSMNVGPHTPITEQNNQRSNSHQPTHSPLTSGTGAGAPSFSQSPVSFQAVRSPSVSTTTSSQPRPSEFENGITNFLSGKHRDACAHLSKAAQVFHEQGDTRTEADCLRHIGISYRQLKEYVAARSNLRAARIMYQSIGTECRQEQLRCDRHLIRIQVDTGNYQAALVAYQDLLRISEREGFPMQRGWCLCYTGHLYNKMGRYDDAFEILQKALNASQEIHSFEIDGFASEEIGYAEQYRGNHDSAMNYYATALHLYKAGGDGKWVENEKRTNERMTQLKRETSTSKILRRFSLGR